MFQVGDLFYNGHEAVKKLLGRTGCHSTQLPDARTNLQELNSESLCTVLHCELLLLACMLGEAREHEGMRA